MKLFILTFCSFIFLGLNAHASRFTYAPIEGKIINNTPFSYQDFEFTIHVTCNLPSVGNRKECGRKTGNAIIKSDGTFSTPEIKFRSAPMFAYFITHFTFEAKDKTVNGYVGYGLEGPAWDDAKLRKNLKALTIFYRAPTTMKLDLVGIDLNEWFSTRLANGYFDLSYVISMINPSRPNLPTLYNSITFRMNTQVEENATLLVFPGVYDRNQKFNYEIHDSLFYKEINVVSDLSNYEFPNILKKYTIVYDPTDYLLHGKWHLNTTMGWPISEGFDAEFSCVDGILAGDMQNVENGSVQSVVGGCGDKVAEFNMVLGGKTFHVSVDSIIPRYSELVVAEEVGGSYVGKLSLGRKK